ATPIQIAVALRWYKRIGMPLVQRTGGNDVGVPRKNHQRCAAAATCPQIIDVAETQVFDRETEFVQALREYLLATRVVWCNRNACDQLAREIQRGGCRRRLLRFSCLCHPHSA